MEDILDRSMRYQDLENIVAGLFRLGTVTDVNNEKRIARVKFPDTGITSGWLPVLITRDYIPDYDGAQCTESVVGGSGAAAYESHSHGLIIRPWMPKVNDLVLTAYLPVRDGQGFILGGIQPWQ